MSRRAAAAEEDIPVEAPVVEASPPENAARITFKNSALVAEAEVPLVDGEAAQEEGADVETPVEEEAQPVEETKAETALRLKELRKADDSFDEDLIEKVLTDKRQSDAAVAQARSLYESDAEFRIAYLRAFAKKGGKLDTADQAELDAATPKTVNTPAPPSEGAVRKWMDEETLKMEATHPAWQIVEWRQAQIDRYITGPKRDAENAAADKIKADETARQRTEEQRAHSARVAQGALAEGEAAFKAYPGVFRKDANAPYGYACTDKAIWDDIVQQDGVFTLAEATKRALKVLGRHQDDAPVTRSATSPRTNNVAVHQKKSDPAPGEARITFKTRVR